MIPRFVRPMAFACIVCAGGGASSESVPPSVPSRPSILLILADDMGWGDLGCYNPESRIPTPHLDRLAAEGMRFTDAHSPSSVCTPTRYGLLTGRYAWRTRMTRGVLNGYSPALIEPGRVTLPSMLQDAGYRTACIGKWHLGFGDATPTDYAAPLRPGPLEAGFDECFVIPASLDMPPYCYVVGDRPEVAPTERTAASAMRRHGGEGYWREGAISPGFRHEDVLPRFTSEAEAFLGRQTADAPFFLYLPLASPHTPWMPTPEFRGRTPVDWYGDFLAQTDASIGRLLATLEARGLRDSTIVVLASDNGAHWLPTDIEKWGHRSNGPWRGQKADIWEAGHRVPFLVRWPGVVAPGSTSDTTICLTDVIATVAEIVGREVAGDMAEDSFSFLPALTGRPATGPADGAATGHGAGPARESIVHHSSEGMFAIREGSWKLALGLGSGGFSEPRRLEPEPGGPRGQLYDLAADPGETRDLWLERPEVVERLEAKLARIRSEGRSRP